MRRSLGLAVGGVAALAALYALVLRPWHLRWGATEEEVRRPLPGDALLSAPAVEATHAITIRASPEEVWPWLVQIGQGRGGLYSYDWLENLFGLDIHSADRILPAHQDLAEGDVVPLAPSGFGPRVRRLVPHRTLLLHGDSREDPDPPVPLGPGEWVATTWVFHLEPLPGGRTRLLERFRYDHDPSLSKRLFDFGLEKVSFVMQRRMLLGLRDRAEGRGRYGAPPHG